MGILEETGIKCRNPKNLSYRLYQGPVTQQRWVSKNTSCRAVPHELHSRKQRRKNWKRSDNSPLYFRRWLDLSNADGGSWKQNLPENSCKHCRLIWDGDAAMVEADIRQYTVIFQPAAGVLITEIRSECVKSQAACSSGQKDTMATMLKLYA